MVNKKRKGKGEGRLLEVLEKAPYEIDSICPHFGECGGCNYQNVPYELKSLLYFYNAKEKDYLNLSHFLIACYN